MILLKGTQKAPKQSKAMKKNGKAPPETFGGDFKRDVWIKLRASERLARSWAMRKLLKNPGAVHDKKLLSLSGS